MTLFNVSLLSEVDVSGSLSVSAVSREDAEKQARSSHSRSQVRWEYAGQHIGAYTGPLSNIWAVKSSPYQFQVSLTSHISIGASQSIESESERGAFDKAKQFNSLGVLPWKFGGVGLQYSGQFSSIWSSPPAILPPAVRFFQEILEAVEPPEQLFAARAAEPGYLRLSISPDSASYGQLVSLQGSINPPVGPVSFYSRLSKPDPVQSPENLRFIEPTSAAWDGNSMWVSDSKTPKLSSFSFLGTSTQFQSIDLSPFGETGALHIAYDPFTRLVCWVGKSLILIDPETRRVVGRSSLPNQARRITFDGAGMAFCIVPASDSSEPDHIYNFVLSDIISGFPRSVLAKSIMSIVIKNDQYSSWMPDLYDISCDGRFLWATCKSVRTNDSSSAPALILKIDPEYFTIEKILLTKEPNFSPVSAFSIAVIPGSYGISKSIAFTGIYEDDSLDLHNFIARIESLGNPSSIKYQIIPGSSSRQGYLGAVWDGRTLWTCGSANPGSMYGSVYRTDFSSEIVQIPTVYAEDLSGLVWDGTSVWAVVKSDACMDDGTDTRGLIRFSGKESNKAVDMRVSNTVQGRDEPCIQRSSAPRLTRPDIGPNQVDTYNSSEPTLLGSSSVFSSSGIATLRTYGLPPGNQTLYCSYSEPDTEEIISSEIQYVVRRAVTTAVLSSINPVDNKSPVQLVVTVSSNSLTGSPTGLVDFFICLPGPNWTPLGKSNLVNDALSSHAILTIESLNIQTYQFIATYEGDSCFEQSTSDPYTLEVSLFHSMTSVLLDSVPISAEQFRIDGHVVDYLNRPAPLGKVVMSLDGTTFGPYDVDQAGYFQSDELSRETGQYVVQVNYLGDQSSDMIYDPSSNFISVTIPDESFK